MNENLSYKEKMAACAEFVNKVAEVLGESYELVGSCNRDASLYLIPKGTIDQLSYYGKPDRSLRFSDHWNWLSNLKKCKDPNMVQCRSLDMPWCRRREEPGKATKPRFGVQVCLYDDSTKCYHHVFGDKFDRKAKTWTWIESDPSMLAVQMLG